MANGRMAIYLKGEVVFEEGDPADCMYILSEGEVELTKPGEHGAIVLKTISRPKEFFGEMALIDGKPRSATATATRDSKLIVVDGAAFETLLRTNGAFAVRIISTLSARIRGANVQIVDLAETDPKERALRGVADYAFHFGKPASGDARYVETGTMRAWINSHSGVSMEAIDAVIYRLTQLRDLSPLKDGSACEDQGKPAGQGQEGSECLVVSGSFMRRHNRRQDDSGE